MAEIITRDLAKGQLNIGNFYLRRLSRILPALLILTACLLVLGALILLPNGYERLASDVKYATTFLINFKFSKDTGYFGDSPDSSWLLHCWSLAVEFQFYIIFPIVMLVAWRIARARGAVVALILIALASAPISYILTPQDQMSAFYLLPSRGWEFVAGALIVFAPSFPRKLSRLAAYTGIVMVAVAAFTYDNTLIYPSLWPLLPVLGTSLVIWARHDAIALDNTTSQFLGNISYSLYLWHWPVISIAKYAGIDRSWSVLCFMLAMAILLGWLSYRFVENRYRGAFWKTGWHRPVELAAVAACCIALAIVANSPSSNLARIPAHFADLINKSTHTNQFRERACFLQADQKFSELKPECTSLDPTKPTLLIWGDSHAAHLYPGIAKQPWISNYNLMQITASACGPIHEEVVGGRPFCPEIQLRAKALIEKIKPDILILTGRTLNKRGDPDTSAHGGATNTALSDLVKSMHNAGVDKVYVVGPVPKWHIALPQLIFIRNRLHLSNLHHREKIVNAQTFPLEDSTLKSATKIGGGQYISLMEPLCVKSKCLTLVPTVTEDAIVQFDTEHITVQGSEWLASNVIGPALGFPAAKRFELALDQPITFNEGAIGTQLLASGWMPPEGWGTWTAYQDRPGVLYAPIQRGQSPSAVKIVFWGQLAPSFTKENFTVIVNGTLEKRLTVTLDDATRTEVIQLTPEIRESVAKSGGLKMEFIAKEGRSSHSMGLNQDDRVLGFGIKELTLLR